MVKLLKPVVITLLVGIVGALMVTASQRNPASKVHALHVRLSHPVIDELPSNKSSEYISQELSAFLDFINVLPLFNIFIGVSLASLALLLYKPLFAPLEYVRELGEAGFITDGRNKREVGEQIRKRKQLFAGKVPPVYPNGWFTLARTAEVKNGEVKYVKALGHDFAIYRGEDGTPYALNAFCPNDGTNLGVGGKVKGDCIQSSDGWTFRGTDGVCVDIPTDQKEPDDANTRAWDCVEVMNFIFIWHHAERDEPDWFPEEIEDIETGKVHLHGYTEHYVNSHIEDIPAGGADFTHLDQIHGPFVPVGSDLRYKNLKFWNWIKFTQSGEWFRDKENKHISRFNLDTNQTVFGYEMPGALLKGKGHQIGPSIIRMDLTHPIMGNIYVIITLLPVEPMVVKALHHFYTTSRVPRPFAKLLCLGEAQQWERDMMIWNHKKYHTKPLLVKEEPFVAKHRRHYSQFYSENSVRYTPQKDGFEWEK